MKTAFISRCSAMNLNFAVLFLFCALTISFPVCAAARRVPIESTSAVSVAASLHNELSAIEPKSVAQELDFIFSLAAYTIVYKNWQERGSSNPRGHNIGGILVDPNNNPVAWNLNSVGITNNSTQHGEIRLMQHYIESSNNKYLENYTIFTTLEPCIMCSGMMSLAKVGRVVYGQTDENYPDNSTGFGRAVERLRLDSREIGGYAPYPRVPRSSDAINLPSRTRLEAAFSSGTETDITVFLTSEYAKEIFRGSALAFYSFEVKFPENRPLYDAVRALIGEI
jgi:tRNA(Arg) A34 adenosine deaminase TadA